MRPSLHEGIVSTHLGYNLARTDEGEPTAMTYCLAMRLRDGLVMLSDTRTNAGVDDVSTYRKLHVFHPTPDRTFVVQSAGNLATTQEVLDRAQRDLDDPSVPASLGTAGALFEAALYLGRLGVEVAATHRAALSQVNADGTSTFLLSGQVGDSPPDVLLVYPEGNYIRASDERPFLQIGETKYGKFLLELATEAELGLEDAAKAALGSMISTARANLSVGPPYDLGIYRTGSHVVEHSRIDTASELLGQLEEVWARHLRQGLDELPMVDPTETSCL
jgi:putative proteasome-type protease